MCTRNEINSPGKSAHHGGTRSFALVKNIYVQYVCVRSVRVCVSLASVDDVRTFRAVHRLQWGIIFKTGLARRFAFRRCLSGHHSVSFCVRLCVCSVHVWLVHKVCPTMCDGQSHVLDAKALDPMMRIRQMAESVWMFAIRWTALLVKTMLTNTHSYCSLSNSYQWWEWFTFYAQLLNMFARHQR